MTKGKGRMGKIRLSLANKLIPIVAIGFILLSAIVVYLLNNSTDAIIRSQANAIATMVNARTRAMRGMYSEHVVRKMKKDFGDKITGGTDFTVGKSSDVPGELPLPAVMVRLIGEKTDAIAGELATSNLISEWNVNKDKGLTDDFQRDAWKQLEAQQTKIKQQASSPAAYSQAMLSYQWQPISEVETENGKPVFRYLAADPASDQSCVNCHNDLEQRSDIAARRTSQGLQPKTFQLGELMGALSITVPLETAGAFAVTARNKIIGTFLVGALIVLVIVSLIVKRSVRNIQELTRLTTRVVSEADLSHKIEIQSTDEVGQLAAAFSAMMERIRSLLVRLKESAQMLDKSISELSQAAQAQNQTVSGQATALQETQVTAQEIKQTSSVAADKAQGVLEQTERAEAIGKTGEVAVEKSLSALASIRGQVEEIAEKISTLSDRTVQVGDITQTVKDLADQSNMLALNAAIEAVRSGEHGRGFAVVAREIRSLADQSIQATARVREILDDISDAIKKAVDMSSSGAERIETSLADVRSSGDNIKELSTITRESAAAVRQIAAAVSQQNAGIAQIFTAVTEQSRMMDNTAKQIRATEQAVTTLQDLSRRLIADVQSFRF